MFRATQHIIIQNRALLLRRKPVDLQVLSVSRIPQRHQYKKAYEQEREPCPPPPPKLPPPKDDRLLWGTMAALVVAGSFAVYAKHNPEVRDWLTINLPWFDDFIAVMYQENMTYTEFVIHTCKDIQRQIQEYMKPNPCDEVLEEPKKISCDAPGEGEEAAVEEKEEEEEEEEPGPCELLPPPIFAKDICEFEACLRDLGDIIIHNYMTARDASRCYSKFVAEVMRKFSLVELRKLEDDNAEREQLVKQSLETLAEAEKHWEDIHRYFLCGMEVPKDKKEITKQVMKMYEDKITIIKNEFKWANELALSYDALRKKVAVMMEKYAFEIESFYSSVDYANPRPMLKGGDPDFLFFDTLRFIKHLRTVAADEMEYLSQRIDRAYKNLPQCDKKKNEERDKCVQDQYNKRKGEVEQGFKTRMEEIRTDYEKETKQKLDLLAKKHAENIVAKLKEKEEEAMEKFDRVVAERAAPEKRKMDIELREMAVKLMVIEAKLNARLQADEESRRSKRLFTAGSALLAATKKGEPNIKVDKELKLIEKASGDNDKLVATVLHSIPPSIWEKGIVPESVLKKNYHSIGVVPRMPVIALTISHLPLDGTYLARLCGNYIPQMEKVALEVALVEEEGSPLPIYWLSWLQSTLLFMKLSSIPQAEIDNPPKEPFEGLDTFDLLQRARFWVDRGNLAAALRYVAALEGASRAAALTWHNDAQDHCVVRQAAEAILAHAAAMGLKHL